MNTLLPIIQASQLLQARKTDDDVNSICEMCDKMNANQVSKHVIVFKNKFGKRNLHNFKFKLVWFSNFLNNT